MRLSPTSAADTLSLHSRPPAPSGSLHNLLLKVSRQIYSIYQKYIAPEDILVYSIDEVFIDATAYLSHYQMSARDLAMTMIREVLYTTGITATAGIGTNLYLAKLAMDITAKHAAPDKDGVRIAELDEESFRYLLWDHKPLTDFWQTGPGTVRRLESLGIHTMGVSSFSSVSRSSDIRLPISFLVLMLSSSNCLLSDST